VKAKSSVHGVLVGLRQRGRIDWAPNLARSIRLVSASPVCGSYVLPFDVAIALARFCAAHEEEAADVLADAVTLHLDALKDLPADGISGSRDSR
jgi:hypothetical protein